MKPAGTVEADLGRMNPSTGVQMHVSVTWKSGRTYLELREEPQGKGTPSRQYRHFHVRSDRLPDLIRKLIEADNLIAARGLRHGRGREGRRSSPTPSDRKPGGPSKDNPITGPSRAREAGQ